MKLIRKFLRWEDVSTSPNPQAGGTPLVGCSLLLIQYIRSYAPYLEGVPPPEDAPCSCDTDPLVFDSGNVKFEFLYEHRLSRIGYFCIFFISHSRKLPKQHFKLTLILLTWTKWWAPASASKWRMGFNSAFKGLSVAVPSILFPPGIFGGGIKMQINEHT
jgi:hypothetical protein